ncbi:hypothetical protein DQ04_10601010 [Trypanosoma grayi]|uniref:hypothetical protein n=1 Tax=Trypanosoma grayi TaxID=71804 RepID=UPI0004F47195|nr:hypothetical protein DQ04_10601010 [Trypanosoma grayi]KEG07193.1 hypothetical protein DQ04_10601010 [Trypanosoma grayi]
MQNQINALESQKNQLRDESNRMRAQINQMQAWLTLKEKQMGQPAQPAEPDDKTAILHQMFTPCHILLR